jgi:hypothetical protein
MAALPEYNRNGSVETGTTGPVATAAAFSSGGLDESTGRQFMGATLGVSEALDRRRRQDDAAWAVNTASQAQLFWTTHMEDLKKKAGSGAGDFTKNVSDEYSKFMENYLDGAPSGESQLMLRDHLNRIGEQVIGHASAFEDQERQKKFMLDAGNYLDNNMAIVALDPTKAPEKAKEAQAFINAMHDRIPASELDSMKNKASDELYFTAMQSLATTDPKGLLKSMQAGEWNGKVSGPRFSSMLEHVRNQVAEGDYLGQVQQGELIKSNLAEYENNGDIFKLTKPDFTVFGKHAQAKEYEYSMDLRASGAMYGRNRILREGSPQQIQNLMEDMAKPPEKPFVPGGDGLPEDVMDKLNHATMVEYKRQMELRQNHPADAGLQDPGVMKAFTAWQDASSSNDPDVKASLPALRANYFNKTMAAQIYMGVAPTQVQFATQGMALSAATRINNLTDKTQLEMTLKNLSEQYGEHWGSLLNQMNRLPDDKRPPAMVSVLAANVGQPYFGVLMKTMHTPTNDLKDLVTKFGGKDKEFDASMEGQPGIQALRSSMTTMNGNDQSKGLDEYLQSIKQVAMQLYVDKKASSEAQAVQIATKMLVNNTVGEVNGVSYLAPRNFATNGSDYTKNDAMRLNFNLRSMITHQANLSPDKMNLAQFSIPAGLDKEAQAKPVRRMILNNSFWHANQDGRTMSLWVKPDLSVVKDPAKQGGPFMLLGKDGYPITVDCDKYATQVLSYGNKTSGGQSSPPAEN